VVKIDVLSKEGLKGLADLPKMDLLISTLSGTGLKDPADYRALYVDGPRRLLEALTWVQTPRVWMLGSTGVYGESEGEWVNEATEPRPLHRNGRVQLEAERVLQAFCDDCSILRLSGLYGPGRERLVRQAMRKRPFLKPDVWSNQIHGEDVAETVAFLVARNCVPPPVLLVSDTCPARRREIFAWVRETCGCPEGGLDEDHPRKATANRGNKRICTDKLKSLGVSLRYPTYREGLRDLCEPWTCSFPDG
jgi:nucleoside-diphosphate-sugar epimerase